MSQDYKPVSCALYDSLEAYCVKKSSLNIVYIDGEEQLLSSVLIKDLQTQNKQEFVILSNNQKIRLDKIIKIEESN